MANVAGAAGGRSAAHPTVRLDEVVHQRTRLGILTVLAEVKRARFGFVGEALGLTDGNLSRHLTVLAGAGYVHIEKGYEQRRPRTWLSITRPGRRALDAELALLADLAGRVGALAPARPDDGSPPAPASSHTPP